MEILHLRGANGSQQDTTSLTIGAYDGVHLGHRRIIAAVREAAHASGTSSTVVTFDRHPAGVVRPASAPKLLTNTAQKLELLASTGIDRTVVVHFDQLRSEEPAEEFVSEILVDHLRARTVIVGRDFHFGYKRQGDVPLLARMGKEMGFSVTGLELLTGPDGSPPVSSTRIRELLGDGNVAAAAQLLGRNHEVRGTVHHGDHRGRELGYPTANVTVAAEMQLPADGVYAGWYERPGGSVHRAAISLGRRPTFYRDSDAILLVEAFLLDFSGDLYGEMAKVRFESHLRGQSRFDSAADLIEQMGRDVARARTQLGSELASNS